MSYMIDTNVAIELLIREARIANPGRFTDLGCQKRAAALAREADGAWYTCPQVLHEIKDRFLAWGFAPKDVTALLQRWVRIVVESGGALDNTAECADALRVEAARHCGSTGWQDEAVLRSAERLNATLVTCDSKLADYCWSRRVRVLHHEDTAVRRHMLVAA